jgi:hypothetical protein
MIPPRPDGGTLLYHSLVEILSTTCVFADETYLHSSEGEALRVAAWAIPRADLRDRAPSLRAVLRGPLRHRSQSVLNWLSEHKCLGLINDMLRPTGMEQTEYTDLGVLPPHNEIWQFAVGFTVVQIAALAAKRWPLSPRVIYHDPQSLAQKHKLLFRESLKTCLSYLENHQREKDYPGLDVSVSVLNVQEVPKAPLGSVDSDVQLGTQAAHWLTKALSHECKLPTCVQKRDLTEVFLAVQGRS